MNLFEKILEKLGLKHEAPKAGAPTSSAAVVAGTNKAKDGDLLPKTGAAPVMPKPAAMPVVDVVAKLEAMAKKNPQDLNWKRSIVDLLKLLGLDSGFEARKELATELGCPANLMGDSASMNTWLHKTVLRKLAENGGNIPRELLD